MKIAPGIYSMSQDKGGHVHAYLLDDGKELTLIDALYDDDGSTVLAELAAMGHDVSELEYILLTHAHKSHVGGLAALVKASGAMVFAHEWEVGIIDGRRKSTPVTKVPRRPFQVVHLQLGLAFGFGKHVPCDVDETLQSGYRIGPLEVVETPGHTPGCVSFWWPERRALFVGDVIATWPELAPGWPGLTLDNARNLRSVQQLTDFSNAEILCVGHGEPITHDAAARVREIARHPQPRTSDECP